MFTHPSTRRVCTVLSFVPLFLLAALPACRKDSKPATSDGPTTTTAAPAPAPAPVIAPAARAEVHCYAGTSEILFADGRKIASTNESLLRRTLSPSQNKITEEIVSSGGRAGRAPRELSVEMLISGDTMTVIEKTGTATNNGTGTLTGPAWAWTSWRTETTLPSGSRKVSIDTLAGSAINAETKIFNVAGELQVTTTQRFTEISNAEWEARRKAALSAKPAAPK